MSVEDVRTELVRSRGFIRGAETQLSKALAALDALDAVPPPEPEPEPEQPMPDPDPPVLPPIDGPPPPSSVYPNMPAEARLQYQWEAGITPAPRDGVDGWITRWGFDQVVNTVSSGLEVSGPCSAVRMTTGGPHRTVYISDKRTYPPDYPRHGGKLWYWGTHTRQAPSRMPDQGNLVMGGGELGFLHGGQYPVNKPDGTTTSAWLLSTNVRWDDLLGKTAHFEVVLEAESSPRAGDGKITVWLNGAQVGHRADMEWAWTDPPDGLNPGTVLGHGFDGFEWHWTRGDGDDDPGVGSFVVHDFVYAGIPMDEDDMLNPTLPGGGTLPPTVDTPAPTSEPSIDTVSLGNATENQAYTATMTYSGGSGTPTWSIISGSLPTGLSLAGATGVISGTPTVVETQNFTVQVSDSAGTDTQALGITVNAASALYPNEPAGMTLIDQWDGTDANRTTSNSGETWERFWGWDTDVTSIVDATNPLGTGYVLQMDFTDTTSAGAAALTDWGPNYNEIYFMYRVWYPSGFTGGSLPGQYSHKNFYFGMAYENRPGSYATTYYMTNDAERLDLTDQYVTSSDIASVPGAWTMGGWNNMEMRAVMGTNPGDSDGILQIWMNGTQIVNESAIQWNKVGDTHGFNGFHWYAVRTPAWPAGFTYRIGELKLMGK